jgi:PAS domain S-box-containing protein
MEVRTIEIVSEAGPQLRRHFAEYDALYRKSPNGIAILDDALRYVRMNEAFARFFAESPEALAGRSVIETLDGLPPDFAERVRQLKERDEPLGNLSVTVRSPAGEQRQFVAHLYSLEGPLKRSPDEPEQTTAAVGLIMVDVTQQRRATEALRNSEARYRDVVDHSVYGICSVDGGGKANGPNPAMLRILGCSTEEEFASIDFTRDVFRFSDQQAQLFATCREQGWLQNAVTEWRRRDGGIVAIRLHLRRVDESGEGKGVAIVAEDITEVRALERQLQQAQKFEAIGQLAGGIAHDFNNVIGAIIGWAEIGAEQNRENAKAADRFLKIREQAERAASLTRELLAFARRQVLQPRAIDLNAVVRGLASFLDRVIGKDISVEVAAAPLDAVKADPTQVEQVVMNLCLNARDAMPDGGRLLVETGMVEVDESYTRYYPGVSAGRYAVLSVSDTGMGMDAETLERIFEPFFTTKDKGKGTGLGLATVYGIVKQHEGFLHVYSEPGQGSLFRIYFPAMPGGIAERTVSALPSVGQLRGTETILIAEDHESIREMARQTLAGLGYRVLSAADGEEALQLSEQHVPEVAVLDVIMPRLGGAATAQKLLQRFPAIKIVFTSGYSRDRDERTANLAESAYLQKPYSPTSLGRLVREMLDCHTKDATAERD